MRGATVSTLSAVCVVTFAAAAGIAGEAVRAVLRAPMDRSARGFDVKALPATYLIDKQGRLAAAYVGVVNGADLETNVQALLAER